MLKEKNDPKRKDQLITIIKTLTQMHNKRVDALTKLDAREARNKEKSDAK